MKLIESNPPTRGNGVTIMMKNQVFYTQPPIQADNQFLMQASYWFSEFQKGQPRG